MRTSGSVDAGARRGKPGLDVIAGRGERGLRIERGRVEHPGVRSNTHRRDRPIRIAAITLLQLLQNRRVYRRVAARPQLLVTAAAPAPDRWR